MKRYLMVHDLVWISTTVAGQALDYDFAALEAVVAAQYDFGPQDGVVPQVADLMAALIDLAPFAEQNRATAFVASATLLAANGCVSVLVPGRESDALAAAAAGPTPPADALAALTAKPLDVDDGALPHHTPLRSVVTRICTVHHAALAELTRRGTEENV